MSESTASERPSPPSDATVRTALLATGFNYTDSVWWRADDDGHLRIFVNCNDVFFWGCSDLEEITDDNVRALVDTIAECEAIQGRHRADDAPLLWIARQRGERPQGAMYKHLDEALWPLFDAAGPEREITFGNPKPQPSAASA